MPLSHRLVFVAVALWIAGGPQIGTARAEDFQVNTYTTGGQTIPAVAMGADGDFVVVWQSTDSGGTDSSTSVQGQRYAADGTAAGGQFQVNTYTSGSQTSPAVAFDAAGNFVVMWESSVTGQSSGIFGQRYTADGSAMGGEFKANTDAFTGIFREVLGSVAMDSAGDLMVVWGDYEVDAGDPSGWSVQGRRYASDGSPQGDQFQVNTYTTDDQHHPVAAMGADGAFVVVWELSVSLDSSDTSARGQRFASDSSAEGGEFQVSALTASNQDDLSVAMDADGDFVVVWHSYPLSGDSLGGIQGQRFASDGTRVGGELHVNSYTPGTQGFPAVAMDADGDFVVIWDSFGSSGTDTNLISVQAQRYASDGSRVAGQFQVNTYTPGFQGFPAVASDALGRSVAVWSSSGSGGTDTDGASIQGRLLPLFVDGFESGDTSSWSQSVP